LFAFIVRPNLKAPVSSDNPDREKGTSLDMLQRFTKI
jgi:hypothetical protein